MRRAFWLPIQTILLPVFLLASVTSAPSPVRAQEAIYDESKVPEYTLPDPLTLADGTPVDDATTWWNQRRPQLLRLFRKHVYGQLPGEPPALRIERHSADREALGGTATRTQVTLHFTGTDDGPQLDLLVYLPNGADEPVPVFTGLNFAGNHTVWPDSAIRLPDTWVPEWGDVPSNDGEPVAEARGARQRRWPVETIVDRGYGLVTAYYGDLFPDRADGFDNSVYQLYADEWGLNPTGGNWSAISAWAWGLRRMMDYAVQTEAIDADRVIAVGHSRLAKTALWAGANDRRFAAVIDNASGCGGSALFRRRYGERVVHIDKTFPHWFRTAFSQYRENESALPVDQHQLLALSAPRPLLISAKTEDQWADPKGMFLAAKHATPVWTLLGHRGLSAETMPTPDQPVLSRVGYYLRSGEHDVLPTDWAVFLDFADRHVRTGDAP